jgi:DNA-binding YbaB/EbfC family protein
MLGDLMGMMGKLQQTREKVQETKKRLDTVSLSENSRDDLIRVIITANRELKEIHIDDCLLEDREALEDYLVVTLNKAIQKATKLQEAELSAVAREGMPDIPGLDQLLR